MSCATLGATSLRRHQSPASQTSPRSQTKRSCSGVTPGSSRHRKCAANLQVTARLAPCTLACRELQPAAVDTSLSCRATCVRWSRQTAVGCMAIACIWACACARPDSCFHPKSPTHGSPATPPPPPNPLRYRHDRPGFSLQPSGAPAAALCDRGPPWSDTPAALSTCLGQLAVASEPGWDLPAGWFVVGLLQLIFCPGFAGDTGGCDRCRRRHACACTELPP